MILTELHERILYPVVRVRAPKAGGSGTIIYSEPDPENDGEFISLVLTNHHVIDDAIEYKKVWDSMIKKDIKKEIVSQVDVEIFDYVRMSHVNSSNNHKAEIVAYDKAHDLAVLRLLTPKQMAFKAQLFPKGKERDIKVFTPVWITGASLLHDPFSNPGHVTYLSEEIENKLYWMTNANAIFGNSGGAVFLAETGQFVGVPSRVTTLQLGFGLDVTSWMAFFCPIPRVYQFFEEQQLNFIYDSNDTLSAALERRKRKAEDALRLMASKGEDD